MRGYFAQVRRAGFDIGLSTGKLTKAMVDVLLQLPPEAAPSKELVVQHLAPRADVQDPRPTPPGSIANTNALRGWWPRPCPPSVAT